ncbi:MAG: hypothetical protein KF897_15025 [Opitutaceae bacterium]|jgi:hypothetical protein|nr:hypothetical protein [Opitutaceae bacterium]
MSHTTPPIPVSGDVKINLTRLSVVLAVIAGIAAFAGAWFVLPYRVDAAEKTAAEFAVRVERRFEATEAEQRQQREILIRIDENVKALKEQRPR